MKGTGLSVSFLDKLIGIKNELGIYILAFRTGLSLVSLIVETTCKKLILYLR